MARPIEAFVFDVMMRLDGLGDALVEGHNIRKTKKKNYMIEKRTAWSKKGKNNIEKRKK